MFFEFDDLGWLKVIATDVDGTLANKNYQLNLNAINYIRKLENLGIKVILITGHTFPTVSTLSQYIGTSGPVVAENGCVVGFKWDPILLGEPPGEKEKLIEIMDHLGFYSPPANKFKFIDLAFKRTEKSREITASQVKEYIEKHGFTDVEVSDSGFAIHIAPKGLNKGVGLKEALKMINVKPSQVLYFGDGENDIPGFKLARVSVAVANAPESVKKLADIVAENENGEGFSQIVREILKKLESDKAGHQV
ncbi:MAG: phosphoglycolate phosphatase [Candidatus Njordarchaeia archaeon]